MFVFFNTYFHLHIFFFLFSFAWDPLNNYENFVWSQGIFFYYFRLTFLLLLSSDYVFFRDKFFFRFDLIWFGFLFVSWFYHFFFFYQWSLYLMIVNSFHFQYMVCWWSLNEPNTTPTTMIIISTKQNKPIDNNEDFDRLQSSLLEFFFIFNVYM